MGHLKIERWTKITGRGSKYLYIHTYICIYTYRGGREHLISQRLVESDESWGMSALFEQVPLPKSLHGVLDCIQSDFFVLRPEKIHSFQLKRVILVQLRQYIAYILIESRWVWSISWFYWDSGQRIGWRMKLRNRGGSSSWRRNTPNWKGKALSLS